MNPNSNPHSPTYPLPMPPQEFQMAQEAIFQQRILNDPETQREMIRQKNRLIRDVNRNYLQRQKQKAKEMSYQIYYEQNSIMLSAINGLNEIISTKTLFKCRLLGLRCYQYDNDNTHYWQIMLAEQGGTPEVISQLYNEHLLDSSHKLHSTILSKYICTNDNKTNALAWHWMLSQLNKLYEDADVTELPFKPGWFRDENGWHFWTNSDDYFLISDLVEKFSIEHFDNLYPNELFNQFLDFTTKMASSQAQMAILLIYRFTAFLGRFTGTEQRCPSLTIIGKNAKQIAQRYLRTMDNSIDTVNMDSDRIGNIRSRVLNLQDTPAIFLSSDPDSKSTQNRIHEIQSWMNAGLVEGKKITIPFVFCLNTFSKNYHLDNTVVLDCSVLEMLNVSSWYAQIQSLAISVIENSGNFWVDEFRKEYKKNQQQFSVFKTINKLVSRMFESDLGDATNTELQKFLHLGEEEIERQFSLTYGILLDIFRESVLQTVDDGNLTVANKNQCLLSSNTVSIYYDSCSYYFCQEIFLMVCQEAKIDLKSILSLKQQLIEGGFVRTYHTRGNHNRELEVDFVVCSSDGQKRNMSGLAIRKEFFDKVGGIGLYERGKNNETNM